VGCAGTNAYGQANDGSSLNPPVSGLPTYPYSAPIVDHVGRYVDSQATGNFQHVGIRTIRARSMRTFPETNGSAPPRIYIAMGNAVGGYSLSTFFTTKLPAGLKSVKDVARGVDRWGAPLEKLVVWDGYMYPEATDSGWFAPLVDQQDPLGKGGPFDLDDRGNLYSGYPTFGWGIAKDSGGIGGAHFAKVVQMVGCYANPDKTPSGTPCVNDETQSPALIDPVKFPNTRHDGTGIAPDSIIAFRSGTKYYAVIAAQTNGQAIFDVTDPASPRYIATRGGSESGMRRYDRSDAVSRIAYIDGGRKLQIYSYSELASGGAPAATFTGNDGGFTDVAFDDAGNVWASEGSKLWKMAPAGAGYTSTAYTPFGSGFSGIRALAVGSGHVAVVGTDRNNGAHYDIRLAKLEAGGPRLIAVDNFFRNYYHGGQIGYAEPGQYTLPADLQIVKWNSKTYLLYSAEGLGDVYEIQGGDSINATMKTTSFGTVNPNARPTETGPFPGDMVTFVATSSNPLVSYDVSWDFGNEDSGAENNGLKKTGVDITHQYTALNNATKVTQTKLVRAVAVQDTTVNSQLNLVLKLPAPRVGVGGLTNPVTASTTVPLEVTAGAVFKDASDGSVEGHYGIWTIDGVPTKLKPNETIPVGGVGTHTLKFEAFYGKYDASFNGTSPYPTPAINVPYIVKPFRVRLDTPTTLNATTVRFGATPDYTTDPTIITATQWTVSWSLSGNAAGGVATNAAVPPLTGTYAIGVIPHYDVPKVDVTNGSTVTLQINVDPSGLSTPAQPYAQVSASSLLTTPNPAIDKSGCANLGSPCTFTAKTSPAGGSMEGWTFLWTLKRNGVTLGTSTSNPYQPTLTGTGSHTIALKVTKTVFESEVTLPAFDVAGSLCGPLPTSTQVSINKIGCATSCAPGTNITFAPSYLGYTKQACDSFSWNFGDSTTAVGEEATHSYSTSGTKTVTFSITNTNGTFNKTTTVTITGSTPEQPTCTLPSNISFNWSGCSSGGCRTTDSVKFTATRGSASLQSCDDTNWNFGDNTTTVVKSPTKNFPTAGTYTVSLVVSNTVGTSSTISRDITIVTPPAGNCNVAPGPGNFAITFTGAQSGCTVSNAQSCKAGEAVDFISNNYIYPVASCDSFEWDFGDSTAKSSARNPQHAFTNDGNYNVLLKVSNNTGSFTYSRPVVITGGTPAKPMPVITGSFPTAGQKGKVVSFTASSNMETTTGWTWTFGDGSPAQTTPGVSQTSTVTHTFNSAGTFTVIAKGRNSTDVASATPGSMQSQITITNPPAIPEYMYLLPVAVHAKGQGNSSWRTDVQIYNPDPAVSVQKPLEMTASFKGQSYNLVVTKATHIYEDFLDKILDHDDQGPVIITTKTAMVAPQIWTRTYNQTEQGGTFGQFIPAIRLDSAGSGGAFGEGKYYLSGLRHDNRYRTNVGFVNPNISAINATITVRDDRFLAIAQFTRTLQPFQLDQFTLKNLVPTLPTDRPFSLQIEVPPGQWVIAYASFIDGISNDPVFLQAVRESEVASTDHRVSVIPGVGHIGQWRSDVTIFNPDVENPVQFDLEYFDNGGTKLAGATGIVLDSRKFLQYSDILAQGVLGSNVPDGLGMLKISATTPVPNTRYPMTFARTYFDDGANGTFGQGIVGFSGGRPNVKVNKPAIIAGVRQNASYKTNIGLVNVSSTATVHATITLLDPFTGAAASSVQYTLLPNQSIVGAYNGWGAIESGTLKIEADGDVWAFASIIDNKTKDPEYVPATPSQ
jgi:PKD repeat protein